MADSKESVINMELPSRFAVCPLYLQGQQLCPDQAPCPPLSPQLLEGSVCGERKSGTEPHVYPRLKTEIAHNSCLRHLGFPRAELPPIQNEMHCKIPTCRSGFSARQAVCSHPSQGFVCDTFFKPRFHLAGQLSAASTRRLCSTGCLVVNYPFSWLAM